MSKVLRVFLVIAMFCGNCAQAQNDFFTGAAAFVGIIGATMFIQKNKLQQQRRADQIEQDLHKNLEKLSEQKRQRQVAQQQEVQRNRLRLQEQQIENQQDKAWFMDLVAARGSYKTTTWVGSSDATVDGRRCKHITTMPVQKSSLQPLQRPISKVESFSSMKSSPTPRTKQRRLQADEIVRLESQLKVCQERLADVQKVVENMAVYQKSSDRYAQLYLAGLPMYKKIMKDLQQQEQQLLQQLGKK
jgi:hypothetical protein